MKTRNITITIPCEAPVIPKDFELGYYWLMDEDKTEREFKKNQLETAALEWVYQGCARLTLNAIAYGYIDNAEYEIYSVWNDTDEAWEAWHRTFDGEPFDFDTFQKEKYPVPPQPPHAGCGLLEGEQVREHDSYVMRARLVEGEVDYPSGGDNRSLEEIF